MVSVNHRGLRHLNVSEANEKSESVRVNKRHEGQYLQSCRSLKELRWLPEVARDFKAGNVTFLWFLGGSNNGAHDADCPSHLWLTVGIDTVVIFAV